MDPKVLSTGVRYSNLPESYVRPESDRPRPSEVSAGDDVRNWGDCLRLSTSSNTPESYVRPESDLSACDDVRNLGDNLRLSTISNPPNFNNAISEVSASECVPFFYLACEDRQSQAMKQLGEASKAVGFHLVSNSGVPPEEVKEEVLKEASEFFGPPVEEKLDADDPSNAVTLSASFNANQETIHKNVTEGLVSRPAFESSRKGKHSYNQGSSEASDEGGPFKVPASDYKSNLVSSDLDRIRKDYKVQEKFILDVANYVDNVCSVKEGDIVLYEADLKAGLTLPFDPFIVELLRRLGLAPGQLTPNAWRIVVRWLELWKGSVEPSVEEFLYCYQLRKAPRSSSHWCFFARDNDTKLGIKLPSSNGPWKSNYFVVRGEALLEGVNCSWGDPNKFVLDRPNLDDFHLDRVKKVVGFARRIDSQKKAKLPIVRKRKASSQLPSQESSAHAVIPPVIDTTTSSVEAILPLPVVDGPPRPSKGTDDFPSMIRNLYHLVEEGTKILAKLSAMDNEDLEKATAMKDVVMKKVIRLDSAERA